MYETTNPTRDDAPELLDVTIRDIYNQVILEEAIACQTDNGDDADDDLDGQIDMVRRMLIAQDSQATDRGIDHLRQMLTISYLDDEELPTACDRKDKPVGITVQLSSAQAETLWKAAEAIVSTTPDADEIAAFQAILAAIAAATR